ncbi:MAG: flagellar motor switch protein FliM [Rickettsiales bacterium]|nr:MAG: flagellar motor switch protein FliM [Rickettsiales bacterium]
MTENISPDSTQQEPQSNQSAANTTTATADTKQVKTVGQEKLTGIKAVLEQSLQSYDKLPMLEIIFEKFIRQLSTSFRNLTSGSVDISIDEFKSLRFSDYFKIHKVPITIAIFKAIEWENFGMLVLENNMIFTFVDLLLGGKKNTVQTVVSDPERILTSIEQGLAKQISEIILMELSYAFDQITPTTLTFEKLESNPNFVTIARPGDAVIVLKLRIEIEEHIKNVELVIPYKTIEPIKEKMQQVFLGDKFGTDQDWERMLVDSIQNLELPIEAVIINKISTVKEIANLKIGDTINMNHHKDKDIMVRSGPITLFTGKIGKIDNKVAINLKNFFEE